jgi:osmoprotectant transport system ATP-binding protein
MIELRSVCKTYPDGHAAVRDLTLTVDAGTTVALLGPSGCGKTTTLKLINRLVAPTTGEIYVNGGNVLAADPVGLRRHIGYVVQEAGLFPHMTARQNAEVVPRLLDWPETQRRSRTRELFELLGLELSQHGDRYPSELSGGQRQRVGLARAIAADPPILLMDEPFGALDPLTRRRLQLEFRDLNARLRKTVVLVTHDVEEAFLLADRVAVLSEGSLVQVGSPREIRSAPASEFVASFLGVMTSR